MKVLPRQQAETNAKSWANGLQSNFRLCPQAIFTVFSVPAMLRQCQKSSFCILSSCTQQKVNLPEKVLCVLKLLPEAPISHQQTCTGELFIHLWDAQTQKFWHCPDFTYIFIYLFFHILTLLGLVARINLAGKSHFAAANSSTLPAREMFKLFLRAIFAIAGYHDTRNYLGSRDKK